MITAIDHAVIHVHDLETAVADYTALGFTVAPGGEHADGLSHNALVALSDGSYLELIAFRRTPPYSHLFAKGARAGEGFITFALLPTDIENDIADAGRRGLQLEGPIAGGRIRPDGQRIEWETARAHTADLPFLCGDVTPRELRVPGEEAWRHQNGIVGIAGIVIAVSDLDVSLERYSELLGKKGVIAPPHPDGDAAAWWVGNTKLTIIQPAEGSLRHGYLLEHGDGPHTLVLRAVSNATAPSFDSNRTHGVRVIVIAP